MKKIILILPAVILLSGCGLTTKPLVLDVENNIACTQEAKLCPDGSAVGRTGPTCEFSDCLESKSAPVNINIIK